MGLLDKAKQLGELNKMRSQAMKLQKLLKTLTTKVEENGVVVEVSGDQKIVNLSVNGAPNKNLQDAINKAIKKSQELAAKKMQEMNGGLGGMLKAMGK